MAKINELVNRVVMKSTSEGFDETTGKLKAQGKALDDLAKSGQAAAQVTETSAKKQLSVKNAFEAQERRLIGLARAQFEYNKTESIANKFLEQKPEEIGRYNRVMAEQTQRLNAVKEAAERNAAAQQKAAQSMVIPDRVVTMHESVANAMKKTREELVPLFGIGQRYREQIDHVRTSLAAGAIKQHEATAAIQRYRAAANEQVEAFKKVDAATGKYINGTGLARHELINLSRQAQDVAVSLGSGQGFGTVLMQQGSQIADIFISTGATMSSFWEQIKTGAAKIFTPARLAAGGIAAIGTTAIVAAAQSGSAQQDITRALIGVGKASGATVGDIRRIGREASSSFGLSRSEAEEFATVLARTGRIGVAEIEQLTAAGKNLARFLGVDVADAAKAVAQAMTDPRGAEELNRSLNFMDAATKRRVENLFAQNKLMEAQQVLAAGIGERTAEINKTVSTSADLWTAVGNTVSNLWKSFGEGTANLTGIGLVPGLEDKLKSAEAHLANIQHLAKISPFLNWKDSIEQAEMAVSGFKDQIASIPKDIEKAQLNLRSEFVTKMVDFALPDLKGIEAAKNAAASLQTAVADIRKELEETGKSKLLEKIPFTLKEIELAARVAAEAVKELQDKMAQQERRVGRREEVREQFKGTGISADVGMQLNQMKDQLAVASAITGQERMRAQELATINQLLDDGRSKEEATAVAAAQRATTQAQINSQAQVTLAGLQDQLAVSEAVTGQERMAAQEVATRNSLIRQGVDATLAGSVAAQERANAEAEVTANSQRQTLLLNNQLEVSQAVGGAAKIEAQYRATIANLEAQGVRSGQAAAQADAQRANAYAQVNAGAQETLLGLQDQFAVAGAITGAERIRAQEQATFNKLVREGVSATTAEAVAAQEAANARAAATAAVYRQADALYDQAAMIAATGTAWEGATRAAIAYNNALKSGASEASADALRRATLAVEDAKDLKEMNERLARGIQPGQKNAAIIPWPSTTGLSDEFLKWAGPWSQLGTPFGSRSPVPTAEGYEELVNRELKGGFGRTSTEMVGSIGAAINKLFPRNQYEPQLGQDQIGVINRLIEILPEKDQAAQMQRVIGELKKQPISLAREELIKDLTDKIEQLKDSTDALNDTIELDPLYTQGHGYIGIGYYTEGGRSQRIPLDPNTPPHVPDLPTTTPVLPPPTTPIGPNPGWGQPMGFQIPPLTEAQLKYREEHPGTPINFANGGSFMVGGSGGTDSQYIPMRFTPGEMIDVTPPHGRNGGKPTVVNNITNNFNFPPDRSYGSRRTQRQAREGYGRSMAVMH